MPHVNKFKLDKNKRLALSALVVGVLGAILLFALLGWMIEPPQSMDKKAQKFHLSWAKVSKVDEVSTIKRKPKPPEEPPPMQEAVSMKSQISPPALTALPKMSDSDLSINAVEGEAYQDGVPGLANLAVGGAEPLMLIPIHRANPRYPLYALRKHIEGVVEVVFKIDEQGNVLANSLKVVKANPPNVFENSAMRAIANWKFEKAAKGETGERLVKYVLHYKLD